MKKHPAIIHIGGGRLQLPSLQWASEAGLYVVLTDIDPGCPGRALADRFENIGGTDVSALLQLAQNINKKHKLVGAYCSNDFGLPAAAAISEAFSLPGATVASVRNALEKTRAREIWQREGLPVPKGERIRTLEELTNLVADINLPIIIKPPDSSGSRGVSSAWSKSELKGSFENARNFSDLILAEELVQGRHIDVNGLFLEKIFYPCGTLDRFFCDPPYHYPVWGCQPSSLEAPEEHQAYQLVERAAGALGIDEGPVKGDVVFTENGPILLEVGPRFHGDVSTSFVTPHATGSSPIQSWFAYLAGKFDVSRPIIGSPRAAAGWMAIFPETPGIFKAIEGIDSVLTRKGVQEILPLKKRGDSLKDTRDNTSVCGFIWVRCDSRVEIIKLFTEIRGRLKVITE